MSRIRDRRPEIVSNALLSNTLTPAQKVFILVAASLPAEYVDGERRHGSKSMGYDGHFSLHYDYLGAALGVSAKAAKRMAERIAEPDPGPDPNDKPPTYLTKVHPGTYGRPATWQALVVRGDKSRQITLRLPVTPYGPGTPGTRGDTLTPLTYRTPDHPDHDSAHASNGDPRSPERRPGEAEGQDADGRLTAPRSQPHADKEATA